MKNKIARSLLSVFLVLGILFTTTSRIKAQDKLEVKTTFYPVYFLAQQIAGDLANVSMLLDANQDPHNYEISASDVADVQKADLFIYQDDEMEFFVQDLLGVVNPETTYVLEATADLSLLAGTAEDEDNHDHGHDHSHAYDPHTWLDPSLYAQQAENVLNSFVGLDEANAEVYQQNYQALVDELNALDEEYKAALENRGDRRFVVQHAAFGYIAHAYDLEQVSIAGLSTSQEPSAKEIATMQDFVIKNNVEIIYVDPSSNSAIAETVAQANNAELRPLRTLESVSSDELAQGIDYFDVMGDNLIELSR